MVPNLQPSPRVGPPLGCLPRGGANLGSFVLFGAHGRGLGDANLCMFVLAFGGLVQVSAAAFWGFSRGGFPENACIGGAISERNCCEVCRRKSPQNTEKHKTKLCAEVSERPLPKDPFFQLLKVGANLRGGFGALWFQERELAEFCGKFGEFCEKLTKHPLKKGFALRIFLGYF